MPAVAYRAFRDKGVFANPHAVTRAIEDAIDDRVKPAVLEEFKKRTSNWQSDVSFAARKFIRTDAVWLNVFPTGEDKMVWHYVNKGTKSHIIQPVNARFLVFDWAGFGSYTPKTDIGDVYGVAGGNVGETQFRDIVFHPGSEARDFSGHIGRGYKNEFKREIRNAIARGKRAARRF